MANKVVDPDADERYAPGRGHDRAAGDASDPRGEGPDSSSVRSLRNQERRAVSSSGTRAGGGGASSSTGGGSFRYNAGGDTPEPGDLKDREAEAAEGDDEDQDDGFAGDNFGSDSTGKRKARFSRKQKAIAGVGTTTAAGAILGFFSLSSGPLELVHVSQFLDKVHFLSQQDAQDSRLIRIARYIRDPSKPQNSRLGIVGNAVADRLEKKMHAATGLTPEYDSRSGRFKGYKVDRSHERWKDKTATQIKKQLDEVFPEARSVSVSDGEIVVNPERGSVSPLQAVREYRNQLRTSRTLLVQAGYSKKVAYVGSRIEGTRAGWTFHPVQKLDAKIQAKALEAGKSGVDKLREQYRKAMVKYVTGGAQSIGVRASDDTPKDKDGKPTDAASTASADAAVQESDGYAGDAAETSQDLNEGKDSRKELKSKMSTRAKVGAAGLAGLFCIVRGLHDKFDADRMDKVGRPLGRMAGHQISLGSQVQSNQDFSAFQLKYEKEFLHGKSSSGEFTDWNQARSIQAEEGQPPTGPDLPKSAQVFGGNPFDEFVGIPGLSTICDALSSPVGMVISFLSGPVSFVASDIATGKAIDLASDWMTGSPANPLAVGADRGNFDYFGGGLLAGDRFASIGGVPLDDNDRFGLKATEKSLDEAEFKSHGLAYRLLNPDDRRTLAARLIDDGGSVEGGQTVASITRGFGNMLVSGFKNTASLFYGVSHAAAASSQSYDYHGLKKIGFRPSELVDPRFANPFENGCKVTGCPGVTGIFDDSGKADKYKELASKCFGVNISGDPASGWKIDSKTTIVNLYSSNYPSDDCKSQDEEWLRVRFWLLDTNTIEGFDCYDGKASTSNESCTDQGFTETGSSDSSSGQAATGSGDSTKVIGDPLESSVSIECPDGTKDLGVQDAYANGRKIPMRLCAVSNLPCSNEECSGTGAWGVKGADGHAIISSRAAGAVYAMVEAAKKDGVTLTASSTFRTYAHQDALCGGTCDGSYVARPGYSPHQAGAAIDFADAGSFKGNTRSCSGRARAPGFKSWDWLEKNARNYGYKQYSGESWHWDPLPMGNRC